MLSVTVETDGAFQRISWVNPLAFVKERLTRQEAIDYFTQNSSIAESAIRAEVRRYLVIPGQATSYKIGMLKILELTQTILVQRQVSESIPCI